MEPHQATIHYENTIDVEGTERLRSSSASSSSSTSSSEFQDPILDSSETGRNSRKDHDKVEQGTREPEGDESALQSPPIQTMERPTNDSGYRIPSSVFARNKSGAPKDWSTTSNESLFSIHTGNMSFTGDKYSWLMESEDLYNVPKSEESPSTPEVPAPENSSVQPPSNANPSHSPAESATDHVASHGPNEASTTHHPEKEEENEKTNKSDGRKAKPSTGEEQTTPLSSRSNESGHSFAFPLLEGELDRGGSSVKSVKSGLSSVPEKPEQQNKTPSSESNEEQTAAAPEAANASAWSWLSNCMSCFSCRAKTEKDTTASKD